MADCEATNEDFKHLDDGLPADIARLKAAGELERAVALIEAELDAGRAPSSRHACEPSVPVCCARRSIFA